MTTFNLCLLGFGNVGRALVALLQEKADELRAEYGIEWRITGVATRRMGWHASPHGYGPEMLLRGLVGPQHGTSPADVRAWLRAARADVLFEITALEPFTGQPAIEHIHTALELNAHAITANKGPVVHAYEELTALARTQGRRFMFEATVADCLPVFSLFRATLPAARVLGFRGVLNSTTNVLLEAMGAGASFAEGVRRAQALGVTETDPGYDVAGWDAVVKVCALVTVLMKTPLKPDEVERTGISELSAAEVQTAQAAGQPFKLIGSAEFDAAGRLSARVRPERIESTDPLAMARSTSLLVQFKLDVLPGLIVMAEQPNLKSTAYGMLADFINAVKERKD
ncbi:MAG: homoserine dehydrogenase [Pyrinomonadaceae bacterium]